MSGNIGGITQDTLNMMKAGLGDPRAWGSNQKLQKGVTIATGLTWYDLQAPAKNLYPTITPLRNAIPRTRRQFPGDAAHWKQVSAIVGSGYDAMGWVPEGQRSGTMSYQTANKALSYVTLGEEDYLTFEAESAAEGFEDENAMVTFRLLQKMMRKEEMALIGGNATLALGTPAAAPTVSAIADTGSTLPTTTYYVAVVALTFEGWKNSTLAAGVATSKVITGADGKTFTLFGGSSNISAISSGQAITSGTNHLRATTTRIPGAVAYAWYIGTTSAYGSLYLQQITTITQMDQAVALVTTGPPARQLASAITTDNSTNPNLAFDGLLSVGFNTSNLGTVTDQLAAKMTASGRGSVVEIDAQLKSMWDVYNIGPTVMYVNSQEQKDITTLCLTNTSGPLLRYEVPTTPGQAYGIVAGGVIDYYYNPFSADGGYKLPVKLHPDVPPGTILMWAERLPTWYQSNEVPNVAEVMLRRDYYRMDWPLRTRQREYGVYAEEVLAIYATFGIGIITNIAHQ